MKRGVERGSRMKRYIASYMKKHGVYYALVAPYMILFTIFVVVPVIISIYYSFTYYNMLEPARFLGADNYIRLFTQDDVFLTALKNTVIIAGITGPVSFFLCFFLGFWGIHKFYEGKAGMGILYLFTMGLFGIGWLVDLIVLLTKPTYYYPRR